MQHSESIVIKRPEADVWTLVGNPQSWETWIPGVTEVRIEGGGAPSVGTGLSYVWRGKRRDTTITAFETDRVIGVASSEKNYEFSETIEIRETPGATGVTVTIGFEPTVCGQPFWRYPCSPINGPCLAGLRRRNWRPSDLPLAGARGARCRIGPSQRLSKSPDRPNRPVPWPFLGVLGDSRMRARRDRR